MALRRVSVNRDTKKIRRKLFLYIVLANFTALLFALNYIIGFVSILAGMEDNFSFGIVIEWIFRLHTTGSLIAHFGLNPVQAISLSLAGCVVILLGIIYLSQKSIRKIERSIYSHSQRVLFENAGLISATEKKIRGAKIIYTSATLSAVAFIATFGLSPTLTENKTVIDNEIKSSLLSLKDMAERSRATNNFVSLMKVYPILNKNYVYNISMDTSMENDTKYISSELERVIFISPSSPVLDKNLLGKIYDYKHSEGATDNNTFWTYKPNDVIEQNTLVYGSMQVSIPANKCAILSIRSTTHSEPSPMQRNGLHGDSASAPSAMGKPECNNFNGGMITATIYANQILPSASDDLGLKVYFIDLNSNYIDPKFYDRTASNLSQNRNDRNFFDPFYKEAYLILDRSKVTTKAPPSFCIQGYNLGYKENIWSYRSNEDNIENKPCATQ